jgi:hypothetical protein
MDNPEKLATYRCRVHKKTEGDNQKWTIQRNWQHTNVGYTRKQKGQSKMDNPEKLATYKCRVHKKTEGTIKNGQSRETGNIQM